MGHSTPVDASESDVAGRGVDGLRMTRGRPIAAAIIGRAKMRAAFEHFAGNLDLRLTRVVAVGRRAAARILGNTARLRRVGGMRGRIPVACPFPNIADQVIEAVAIRWECSRRRGSLKTIGAKILPREFALPSVG